MGLSISVHGVRYGAATLVERIAWLQDEIIYGGHVTALGMSAYIFLAATLLRLPVGPWTLLVGYMAALIVYSVDYSGSSGKDMWTNTRRDMYFKNMSRTFRYRLLAYVAVLVAALALSGSIAFVAIVLIMGLLGIAYTGIFKSFTKYVPGFKNLYTSGSWATGPILVVLVIAMAPVSQAILLVFLFLFMRSLGNVIYFDMKDVEPDQTEGLKTVPILIGRERTFILLYILNIASFLPLVAGVLARMLPPLGLSMIAIAPFTSYYLKKARAMPYDYTNYLLADVETLLWPPILLIASSILAL